MRKIVVTEYLSLDGIMDEPGHWSMPFWNDEAARFKYDELFASDALLLGRVTYQGFAAAWPTMTGTGDFGERMNNLPKFVVSTTLKNLEWNNSRLIDMNVVEEIAKLKAQSGQDILIAGSGKLVHSLMPHGLIDEFRIMVHPIILGGGKRLFQDGNPRLKLKLVKTQTTAMGIAILTYRPDEA